MGLANPRHDGMGVLATLVSATLLLALPGLLLWATWTGRIEIPRWMGRGRLVVWAVVGVALLAGGAIESVRRRRLRRRVLDKLARDTRGIPRAEPGAPRDAASESLSPRPQPNSTSNRS